MLDKIMFQPGLLRRSENRREIKNARAHVDHIACRVTILHMHSGDTPRIAVDVSQRVTAGNREPKQIKKKTTTPYRLKTSLAVGLDSPTGGSKSMLSQALTGRHCDRKRPYYNIHKISCRWSIHSLSFISFSKRTRGLRTGIIKLTCLSNYNWTTSYNQN